MAQFKNTTINDTGFLQLPVGTTAQRPSPSAGQMRFNTTTGKAEFYNATAAAWLGTAAAGVVATGGTVYDVDAEGTTYRVHVFTSTGNSTFTVTQGGEVEYLIVAGGGGGGFDFGGGGGAGGLLTGTTTLTSQSYTITVGVGGAGAAATSSGSGGNSSALGLTATGGGGGANGSGARSYGPPKTGGSGGGGGGWSQNLLEGAAGIPGQGNGGGTARFANDTSLPGGGGGGGGGGNRGLDSPSQTAAGGGGIGLAISVSGVSTFYAGGGGGGSFGTGTPGAGGFGGGGDGSTGTNTNSSPGTPTTGGGGGGNSGGGGGSAAAGGSGIVIVRYPLRQENPVTVAGKVIGDGLVLDLDFAKPTVYAGSGTVVSDSRLNGITGTLVNGTFGINKRTHRSGLFFDGTDDRLDTSMREVFTTELTVECWYRGTKTSRNHLWNFTGSNLHANFNDGPFPLWMYWEGGGENRVRYNGNFTDGTIKHLVFTHSGSTNKVFLNGAELPVAESGGTQTFSGVGGSGFNVGDTAFGGDIYLIKVYRKALTAAEVSQNFNATRWRFGV